MKPSYIITVDDKTLNDTVKSRISSISITDEVGFVSDQIQIKFDDLGDIDIPKVGIKITVQIGIKKFVNMGTFVIDDVTLSPGFMIVAGKGFDSREGIKEKKTRDFETKNIFKVLSEIAKDIYLKPYISEKYKDLEAEKKIIQQSESALHLLRRLAKAYDAAVKIQGDKLLFIEKGTGKSVTGKETKVIKIDKKDVLDWTMQLKGRSEYRKVEVTYKNIDTGEDEKIIVGDKGPVLKLNLPFNDRIKAEEEAKTWLKGSGYESKTMSLEMPGNENIRAENFVDLSGFKKGADGVWIVLRVNHMIDEDYKTSVELQKVKIDE